MMADSRFTFRVAALATLALVVSPALAQASVDAPPAAPESAGVAAPASVVLPAGTSIIVAPVATITSKDMKEGDVERFTVANDVSQDGVVVIPRGATVKATVTWRTGKGIFGKSAKFELTFNSVTVGGREWALRGTHRQEGQGQGLMAALVFAGITGKSAVMAAGQMVSVTTAEPITVAP